MTDYSNLSIHDTLLNYVHNSLKPQFTEPAFHSLDIIARVCERSDFEPSYFALWKAFMEKSYSKKDIEHAILFKEIPYLDELKTDSLLLQFSIFHATRSDNFEVVKEIFNLSNESIQDSMGLLSVFINTFLIYHDIKESIHYQNFINILYFFKTYWSNKFNLIYYSYFDWKNTFKTHHDIYKNNPKATEFLIKEFKLYLMPSLGTQIHLFINTNNNFAIETLLYLSQNNTESIIYNETLLNLFSNKSKKTVYENLLTLKEPYQKIKELKQLNPNIYHYFELDDIHKKEVMSIINQQINNNFDYCINELQKKSHIQNFYNYALLIACQQKGKQDYYDQNVNLKIVQYLLDNGANVNSREKSTYYKTALDLATKGEEKDIILMLLKHGAYLFTHTSLADTQIEEIPHCTFSSLLRIEDLDFLNQVLTFTTKEKLNIENSLYDFYYFIFEKIDTLALEKFEILNQFGLKFNSPISLKHSTIRNKVSLFKFYITHNNVDNETLICLMAEFLFYNKGRFDSNNIEFKTDILNFIIKNSKFDINYRDSTTNQTLLEIITNNQHEYQTDNIAILEQIKFETQTSQGKEGKGKNKKI